MKKLFLIAFLFIFSVFCVFSQNFDFGDIGGISGGLPGNAEANKAIDKANDAVDKLNGLIPMRFFNALDRKPISGGSVEIPNVGTLTTNNAGKITFPQIPDGNYTLVFSKEGFITTNIDFRVILGNVDFNWFNISPVLPNKDYRIVLEWNEKPEDLDLHFEKVNGYHISFTNMKRAEDGNAILDRDDRQSYGPETITIGKIDPNATYKCWVHDWTNQNNTKSTAMTKQGVVVRVYSQNRLLQTFRIPATGAGTKWNVFRIERGALVVDNTVSAK